MCFQVKGQRLRKRNPTCFLSWYCCTALLNSLSSFKISLKVTWIACVCSHNFLACNKTKEDNLQHRIKWQKWKYSVLGSLRPDAAIMVNIRLKCKSDWHDRCIYKYISKLKKVCTKETNIMHAELFTGRTELAMLEDTLKNIHEKNIHKNSSIVTKFKLQKLIEQLLKWCTYYGSFPGRRRT